MRTPSVKIAYDNFIYCTIQVILYGYCDLSWDRDVEVNKVA